MMTSEPPPPSIVSAPEPPVIVLADAEPRIDNAVVIAVALTFTKSVTAVAPTTWCDALARFTALAATR